MPRTLPSPIIADPRAFHVWDDFVGTIVTADAWTTLVADVADGGATAIRTIDGAGGILSLATEDATDNDEVGIESTREMFLFANNKPLVFEARVQYAEANTDDANIFVGLCNAPGANLLLDNGGAPVASFSGAAFYKIDGGTRWQVISSVATTRNTTDLSATLSLDKTAKTAGGASYTRLGFSFKPYSSTNGYVDFFIDDVHVAQHDFVYTSATEMAIAMGVKNGGANAETLLCDYVFCQQYR
jgi:hypothetical protein